METLKLLEVLVILILRDGFPYLFYIHIVGIKEYRVWGGGTSSKGRKRLKREGKERYWGKKWNWEANTKNRFL